MSECKAELLEVVNALRSTGRLAGGLHSGEQQSDQYRDDRDHDEEFNQRECGLAIVDESAVPFPRIQHHE